MKLSRIKPALRCCITHSIGVIAVAAMALIGGASSAQAKTEITFWHAMDGQLGDAVSELVRQFNQSQGEFEVKAVYKGTYPEVQALAMSAFRQKASPHIVQVYEVGTLSMMLSDAIVPVQRLMRQYGIEPNWGDFIETITGYYAKDGKLASMPFNVSTPILYYNKDIFKKAGLGDTPPATWQEVEAASRVILATGAATCGFTTSWPSWTLLENTFAWHDQPFATNQNGYSGLDTKLLINGDFGLMHIGALAKWQKERIFSYGGRLEEADIKFIHRDCAMLLQSSGSIGSLKKSLGFDWGTGQLPHWGPPYPKANTTLGGATLWVMRGHDPASYKGVVQFLRFVAEPSQQSWWAAATGYLPITKAAVKSLEEQAFYKQNPEQWTGVSQLLNAQTTQTNRGLRLGNYTQVRQAIEMELENIFAGKKTVKEGLDAAVLRGNAILRQFGVTNGAAGQGEI
jgi:sn-glycerol 3-phosphate transport system substrate-binding protein